MMKAQRKVRWSKMHQRRPVMWYFFGCKLHGDRSKQPDEIHVLTLEDSSKCAYAFLSLVVPWLATETNTKIIYHDHDSSPGFLTPAMMLIIFDNYRDASHQN